MEREKEVEKEGRVKKEEGVDLLKINNASFLKVGEKDVFWETEEKVVEDLLGKFESSDYCKKKRVMEFVVEEELFLQNLSIPSKLQTQVNCGIVCLSMACEWLKMEREGAVIVKGEKKVSQDVSILMKEANLRNFSKRGEMFSSQNLSSLSPLLGAKSVVAEKISVSLFFSHLLFRFPLLLAFDISRDFSPGNYKGEKAHWATIKGFICKKENRTLKKVLQLFKLETETQPLHHPKHSSFPGFSFHSIHSNVPQESKSLYFSKVIHPLLKNSSNPLLQHLVTEEEEDVEDVFLVCKQPKSKHQAIWSYKSFLESNLNLKYSFKEKKKGMEDLIIPETLENLNNKVILLYN